MTNDTRHILHHWREAVPNDRMAHLIRDTERSFKKALQMRLAVHGIPFGHWTFLRVLWENDGITQKELSALAGVMDPTTFAALKAMQAQGYVVRKQLPTNRKNVYIHLTAKGRALKNKLVPLAEDTNSISTVNISPDELMTARKVLLTMIENLADSEQAWEARGRNAAPRRSKGAKAAR
jgi:DNA-binding MarR family transcriptional regulator